MHRKVAGVVAAVIALGAAGCGGEDPLTRAQLVRQADVICAQLGRQSNGALAAAGRQLRGQEVTDQPDVAEDLIAKLKRYREAAAGKLEGLEPPEELQDRYDRYVANIRESATLLPTVASLESGDDPNSRARDAVEDENRRLARGMGMKTCS